MADGKNSLGIRDGEFAGNHVAGKDFAAAKSAALRYRVSNPSLNLLLNHCTRRGVFFARAADKIVAAVVPVGDRGESFRVKCLGGVSNGASDDNRESVQVHEDE